MDTDSCMGNFVPIHLIGRKSLHFEKKTTGLYWKEAHCVTVVISVAGVGTMRSGCFLYVFNLYFNNRLMYNYTSLASLFEVKQLGAGLVS